MGVITQARKHRKEDSKGGLIRLEVKLLSGTDVILQLVRSPLASHMTHLCASTLTCTACAAYALAFRQLDSTL